MHEGLKYPFVICHTWIDMNFTARRACVGRRHLDVMFLVHQTTSRVSISLTMDI